MLVVAWCSSVVCSLPQVSMFDLHVFQAFIFHVQRVLMFFAFSLQAYFFHLEEHPKVSGYYQCVTFHSFASEFHHIMYQIATMCAMYACPLITFIYCYGSIYLEIYRKSQSSLVKGIGKEIIHPSIHLKHMFMFMKM